MNRPILLALTAALTSTAHAQVVTCIHPGATIPDNAPSGVTIPIEVAVAPGLVVESVELDMQITHPWVGDLVVTLTAPNGQTIVVLDRPGLPSAGFPGPFGCGGADLLATFTDASVLPAETLCSTTAVPVLAGSLMPAQAFASFGGAPAAGIWWLTVSDGSFADQGVLNSACLRLTTASDCPADLAEPNGVLDFFDVAAFLNAFGNQLPAADFAPPSGVFDFFDVAGFLSAFSAGCP
jgi:subtilisin-like proprotein convertase family protein